MCSATSRIPVIVVASVGAQDIRYRPGSAGHFYNPGNKDGAEVLGKDLDCQRNLRAIGQELHDRCKDDERKRNTRLRFPILRPALQYVMDELDGKAIDQLLLVVTNQDDPVTHRDKDTVFCGYLLALLVEDSWPGTRQIKSMEFIEIEKSPHRADEMYEKMREELIKLDRDSARLYVLTSAGTPQINDGLRHGGINVFGDRCNVIQVDRPEPDPDGAAEGAVRSVPLHPYSKDAIRRGAQALVDHDNFAGALDLLRGFPKADWPPVVLFSLLEHAQARFNLDLHVAGQKARCVRDEFGKTPAVVSDPGIREYMKELKGPANDPFGRVNEVRFLVDSALRNGRYADALFRIALFRESCESILSVEGLGLPAGKHANRPLPQRRFPVLDARLKEVRADNQRGFWSLISGRDRRIVLRFAVEQQCGPEWRTTADLLDKNEFKMLGHLRNKAIHQAEGVSLETIRAVIEPGGLTDLLDCIAKGLATCFGKEVPDDPYPRLRAAIHAVLRER